jgi:hypothetical protein
MAQPDYRGARGSNAGDDFHELWALRQSFTLLDQDTTLAAVTVEGLRAEDENGTPQDTWNAVECTLYYGGDRVTSADRVVIAQLKYSAANPDRPWTIARLTHSTNKKQDNSVIAGLAQAFSGLKNQRPDLAANGNLVVRLVSNQPVDPLIISALSNQSSPGQDSQGKSEIHTLRTTFFTASGLSRVDFEAFAKALDLSECGLRYVALLKR